MMTSQTLLLYSLFCFASGWSVEKHVNFASLKEGYGVTALSTSRNEDVSWEIVAGTKRGTIKSFVVEAHGTPQVQDQRPIESELNEGAKSSASSSLPVFSLSCGLSTTSELLFCGKGDRFVSVWRKGPSDDHWKFQQRLGPHTGWVQDVLWEPKTLHLHSLGCNCVETWRLAKGDDDDGGDNGMLEHWKKSSIENSPSMGVTLSSDLLCLCAFEDGLFFAGGVDGRLHLWNSTSMGQPLSSSRAHDGRVTAMCYIKRLRLLVTASHDGYIKGWKFGNKGGSVVTEFPRSHTTEHSVGKNQRVTTLSALRSKGFLLFGTQKGRVGLLQISTQQNEQKFYLLTEAHLNQELVINAINARAFPATDESSRIIAIIGHSLGLDCLTFLDD